MRKSIKIFGMLALMGALTLGLSGLAFADAPADGSRVAKVKKGKGINYPAYLYAKGQRGERIYKQYIRPAKGYNFDLEPLASYNHVSEW